MFLREEGKDMQVIPSVPTNLPPAERPRGSGRNPFMSQFTPQLSKRPMGETGVEVRLGHELLDDYLRFVCGLGAGPTRCWLPGTT